MIAKMIAPERKKMKKTKMIAQNDRELIFHDHV